MPTFLDNTTAAEPSSTTTTTQLYGTFNSGTILRLGETTFARTEIPEEVKFGIKEQIVTHNIIGGAKVKDMMGDDPTDITWSGFFLGSEADTRANRLYSDAQSKKLLNLTFGAFSASVIIAEIEFSYKRQYWIDYSIKCEVVPLSSNSSSTIRFQGTSSINTGIGTGAINTGNTQLSTSTNASDAASGLNTATQGSGSGFSDFTGDPISYIG